MLKRKVLHVVPIEEGGWAVRERERGPAVASAMAKVKAVVEAKKLAKRSGLGQVVIHGRDGRIQTEYTYGRDPKRHRD